MPFYQKLSQISKKLVLILTISVLMTNNSEKVIKIPYIKYLV